MTPVSDESIILRAPEPDDVDAIFLWENDLGMAEASVSGAPVSRLQVWNYVHNYDADPFSAGELRLIIASRATGERLGHIDLMHIDRRDARAAVAVYIAPGFRRRGHAAAALALLARYALRTLDLHQLWAHVAADNTASLALFRKAGFRPAGRLRSWLRRDGRWVDVIPFQRLDRKI